MSRKETAGTERYGLDQRYFLALELGLFMEVGDLLPSGILLTTAEKALRYAPEGSG